MTDKIYVVFDGFPPDDDWIDSTWDRREWAIARLKHIRATSPSPDNPHGYMVVFLLNKVDAELEGEAIRQYDKPDNHD